MDADIVLQIVKVWCAVCLVAATLFVLARRRNRKIALRRRKAERMMRTILEAEVKK